MVVERLASILADCLKWTPNLHLCHMMRHYLVRILVHQSRGNHTSSSCRLPMSEALNQHQVSPNMTNILPATTESPVQFLQSLFPKDAGQYEFPQPSTVDPDDCVPYDMESFQAIRNKDVPKLWELLEEGKCFDACNLNVESFLHLACQRGDLKTVKFMLEEACVNPDISDDMGRTILHDVCWRPAPNLEIMAALISTICPYTLIAKDRRGHTPFDYARREHRSEWMSFLRENKELIVRRIAISSMAARVLQCSEIECSEIECLKKGGENMLYMCLKAKMVTSDRHWCQRQPTASIWLRLTASAIS